MKRPKFETRRILLRTGEQVARALALLPHLPLDAERPLEFLVREEVKARKPDQNSLMWAGPLKDIAEQCYVAGRCHRAEVWHELFKADFLPEEYDPELCKDETYQKWAIGFDGGRVLVGSTTDLTIKGFAQHLDQIHAFGGQRGVEFHEPPPRG